MTGALAACMGVIGIFNPIWAGIGNIVGPRSARAYAKSGIRGLDSIVLASTISLATASGLFCLSVFFWGDDLMRLLYGSAFAGNRTVVTILSMGVLASALSSGIDYGLWAVGKADKNFRANLFSLGITITLGAFLAKFTGLLGVGAGILVANGGASMIRYIFYRRMKRTLNVMPANRDQGRTS
jgi:O-antigen/teichoic acid export membrane protein